MHNYYFHLLLILLFPLSNTLAMTETNPLNTIETSSEEIQSSIKFDFDECLSLSIGSSSFDFREFKPTIENNSTTQMNVVGGSLYRTNPADNRHSCAPGVNGSRAMCVDILDDCEYDATSEKAVKIDIDIVPGDGQKVYMTVLSFSELAPTEFQWLGGPSGPNNYPTKYAVRVLKNGEEIYLQEDIESTTEWTQEFFDFSTLDDFHIEEPATISFELTAYCPIGNGSEVMAWDLDDLEILVFSKSSVEGGTLTGGPFEFCAGDGEADNIPAGAITLAGNTGANSSWVVTFPDGSIAGLPPSPDAVDFDGAGAGVCSVWNISYEDGLQGLEMGALVADLNGCFSLSNPITVTRLSGDDCDNVCAVMGGTLSGGPFEFCAGDGVADNIPAGAITLAGNSGANSAWVVTFPDGSIAGLPPSPDAVDFDGAGAGVCSVWNISYEDGLQGLEMGALVADLNGCFSLSNPITVTRLSGDDCDNVCAVMGGTLSGGPFEFCAGDGVADNIPAGAITLAGNSGANSAWVVTFPDGSIAGLPPSPDAVDFDGAGAGVCSVWNISYEDGLQGLEMGAQVADLVGCFSLSNPILVTRNQPDGGTLTGGPFEFCAGDGVADNIPAGAITLAGNSGANSAWVVTFPDGSIAGLPPSPDAVDFDGAGAGVCSVWNISYEDGIQGLEMGAQVADLVGCFSLSNPILVTRLEGDDCPSDCDVDGGTLSGGPFEFCAGDGVADNIPAGAITLAGNSGANSAWVVTFPDGSIAGLPPSPDAVDFDGAGAGVCSVWNISYEDGIQGLEMGAQVADLVGCFSLSNPILVTRNQPDGGTLTGGPFEFCAGDGVADNIPAGAITLAGNSGANSAWVVTFPDGSIAGLPPSPDAVDFDGAGAGVCSVWNISYEDGIQGLEMGAQVADLVGCFSLSNPILVTRNQPDGGTLTGGPFEFCAGDGVADNIPAGAITLAGNSGANSAWVVTFPDGSIAGLPPSPDAVDFDGAGAGVCSVWNISYEDGIQGLEMGAQVADLVGCFSLSNPILVTRNQPDGGTLTGGPFEFCAGDGVADNIPAGAITLAGNSGANSAWVVTFPDGSIAGLPPSPDAVDFDGAGAGVCSVWNISYEDGLQGLEMGAQVADLVGCFSLSNPILVTRNQPDGGTLTGGPFEFCAGDGVADNIPAGAITLAGNSGANSAWVVTFPDGSIAGLPPSPDAVDFDGAGAGVCSVWNISYEDGIQGLEMGAQVADLVGCYSLSNPILVTRLEGDDCPSDCDVDGGTLSGGPFEFCAGDGVADNIPAGAITLAGNSGANSAWVVTFPDGSIAGLPPSPDAVDFDGAGAGVCSVWNISYEDGIQGLEMGAQVADLVGCFSLSNPILVTRNQPDGGTLTGGPFEFCAGDGVADNIPAGAITLAGNSGANSAWVVTFPDGSIAGLPPSPDAVDFDGAGAGVCSVWNISYEDGIQGLEMGAQVADLVGCFSLSNPILVTRNQPDGGTLTGGPFEFCAGDGVADNIPAGAITLAGNSGANSAWVVTFPDGSIAGLPPSPDAVDFDGAGAGVCSVWNISYEDGLQGLEMGAQVADLVGCFSLSNPILVTRLEGDDCPSDCDVDGGTLSGGPFEFCAGDGVADNIPAGAITLAGNSGANSAWVVTFPDGSIAGLPPSPDAVDFDGAGAGVCSVWNISYEDGIQGLEMGAQVADLVGCFSLSNPILVTRNQPDGGTLTGGPFEFCAGDGVADNIPAGAITLAGNSGANSAWVVTFPDGSIAGLPPSPDAVDFDGAGAGVCSVWNISYEDGIQGLEMGAQVADLVGCFSLSNPILVTRNQPDGGTLTGGPFEFCVGDGEADNIPDGAVTLSGSAGANNQWVVTNLDGTVILGLPSDYTNVDFDGAGAGTCLLWNLSYDGELIGVDVDALVADLSGCFSLSNSITITRNQPEGGSLAGGPFEFCVGDGEADNIPDGAISLIDNAGANNQWVVTNSDGTVILGLPDDYTDVNFDGAGAGTCLIWNLSYDGDLGGAAVDGMVADLTGCFSLSNSITVTRVTDGSACDGGGNAGPGVAVINEIFADGRVEIKNVGGSDIDISTMWLCDFPEYEEISGLTIDCGSDFVLSPGELVTVVTSAVTIDGSDGEMGLYSTNSFGSSSALLDYVEWGSSGHQRSGIADDAGIWTEGTFVAAFASDKTLSYDGDGNAVSDWSEKDPSACEENLVSVDDGLLEFNISPNPSTGNVNIDVLSAPGETLDVKIFDNYGVMIHNTEYDKTSRLNLDLERVHSGVYYIRIRSSYQTEVKRLLIVNN